MSATTQRTPGQRERRAIIVDASVGAGPDWYGPPPGGDRRCHVSPQDCREVER